MAKVWNFEKGDWSYFKCQLELGLKHWTCDRIWSDVTIEKKLEQFINEVNKALELACPKKNMQK